MGKAPKLDADARVRKIIISGLFQSTSGLFGFRL